MDPTTPNQLTRIITQHLQKHKQPAIHKTNHLHPTDQPAIQTNNHWTIAPRHQGHGTQTPHTIHIYNQTQHHTLNTNDPELLNKITQLLNLNQ